MVKRGVYAPTNSETLPCEMTEMMQMKLTNEGRTVRDRRPGAAKQIASKVHTMIMALARLHGVRLEQGEHLAEDAREPWDDVMLHLPDARGYYWRANFEIQWRNALTGRGGYTELSYPSAERTKVKVVVYGSPDDHPRPMGHISSQVLIPLPVWHDHPENVLGSLNQVVTLAHAEVGVDGKSGVPRSVMLIHALSKTGELREGLEIEDPHGPEGRL